MSTARRHPSVAAVKLALDSGKLGTAALVRLHRWRPRLKETEQVAMEEPLAGDLDLVLWLTGQLPVSVFARTSEQQSAAQRYMQVHLGFADEGMALIDLALTLPPGAGYFSLSVIGTTGAAYADDHANTHLVFQGGAAKALLAEPLAMAAEEMGVSEAARRALAPVLAAVVQSLATDLPIELTGGAYDV